MKRISGISIRTFRRRLASIDSIPQFAILGIASGLVTGLVIIAFRLAIEWPLSQTLQGGPENFEELENLWALALPIGGSLVLIALLAFFNETDRRVGVVHVMERLGRHQGHMPLKNAVIQFLAGVIALASGQSGGREGPAIHLGATGSSLIGHYLKLPNNSIRVLVGCGSAAAISASFNTPIAGVIFSMEVIILEYTVAGFIPVILASVVAALMTQLVFGSDTAFDVPSVSMASFYDLPILVAEGIFIGLIAAFFVKCMVTVHSRAPDSFARRLLLAGVLTGLAAMIAPEIMGVGYDTVNLVLIGELSLSVLLLTFAIKLLVSSTIIALGMPVGIIGPTLFIGAMAGGLFALVAGSFGSDLSEDAFYVMLGMGAMMGAVLQAPLAALMAVLELTNNPNIILPAMLVIVIANLTASQVFGIRSVFLHQMETLGLEFQQNPLSMALNRASVASIMIRSFKRVGRNLNLDEAKAVVLERPYWLLVDGDEGPVFILRREDLEQFLADDPAAEIDLAAIPATRKDVTSILLQATLSEALDALNSSGVQALYVNRISGPLLDSPVGIVTREDIESYYQN
jgi:CIC family chloride channel protein